MTLEEAIKLSLFIYGLGAAISFVVALVIKGLVMFLEATYARKKGHN